MRTPYPLKYRTAAHAQNRRLVSYSEIRSLDCWLKHDLRYVRGLQPIQRFEALNFGTAWDAFQDTWWAPDTRAGTLLNPVYSLDERLERALRAGGDTIDAEARRVDGILVDRNLSRPPFWDEELERMRTLLVGMGHHYAAHYGGEGEWRTIAQQAHFEIPFPSLSGSGRRSSRYWLHGKIDRIVEHADGGMYIVDAKSAKAVDANYRIGYETDRQLPLYAWALRELGWPIVGVMPDAAAKLLPHFPELRQTPFPVYTGEFDENGAPIQAVDPVQCEACGGTGTVDGGDGCVPCEGNGLLRFKTGPRKGEFKTKKRTRPGLTSMLDSHGGTQYNTTLAIFTAALIEHDLNPLDYTTELDILTRETNGEAHSPFFWRPEGNDLMLTDQMLDEAADSLRLAMPFLDKLPPLAMSDPMKCRMCEFKRACADRSHFDEVLALEFITRDERAAKDPGQLNPGMHSDTSEQDHTNDSHDEGAQYAPQGVMPPGRGEEMPRAREPF